jgi:D-alanyl-D-alanine carboxypeptidase/D-alanyl-D-alanine-endopeptidase (penicillin-binding protein 4)
MMNPTLPRRRLVLIVLAAIAFAGSPARGQSIQAQVESLVKSASMGDARVSIHFVDLPTGKDLVSIAPAQPLAPASNMKLLTTAAALSFLGPDFKFTTQLRVDGGTLIVQADGDPCLGDPVLLQASRLDIDQMVGRWVEAVTRSGVKNFDALVIDDRMFDRQWVHPAWPENQLHLRYCAPVSALNFHGNCLDVFAQPAQPGAPPSIILQPGRAPVVLDNLAVTGSNKDFWLSRQPGANRILLRGQVGRAIASSVTIHDPPMFFAGTLQRRLKAAGIDVKDIRAASVDETLGAGRLLAEDSTPLARILVRCNRDSHNLAAEALLKRIGYQVTGQAGSWANGRAALRLFLHQVLGAESTTVVVDDGSGLSKANRVSARAFTQVLAYMNSRPNFAALYRDSLAAPGEEGTLENRFASAKLSSRLRAKSGYISGVVCLSGYLLRDDRTIAFSMLVNDYHKSTTVPKQLMEKIVAAVDKHLERLSETKLGGQ